MADNAFWSPIPKERIDPMINNIAAELEVADDEFALEVLRPYEIFLEGCDTLFRDYRRRHHGRKPSVQTISTTRGQPNVFVCGCLAIEAREFFGIARESSGIRLRTP
jgi:hypothetical protein